MAIPREKIELNNLIEFGIDPKRRIIHFGMPLHQAEGDSGDITQVSVEATVRAIISMEADSPNKPISIYMNSYGGDPYAMLYLVDVILSSSCQFKFYGGGFIGSSATWIMAVCDERYLYPNTTIMIHNGDFEVEGKYDDNLIQANEQKRLMDNLIQLYTDNSFMTRPFWEDVCKRDLHLSAHEVVSLGLADEVIKYKKRGNLRKKRQHHLSEPPSSKIMQGLIKRLYHRVGVNPKVKEIVVNLPPKDEKDDKVIIQEGVPSEQN